MREVADINAWLLVTCPLPQPEEGNKDLRGRIAIIGGSREVPGAVLLAALGAMRAGAGKLQVMTALSCAPTIGVAMPEALVIGLPETEAGGLSCEAIGSKLDRLVATDTILIGPGMVEERDCENALSLILSLENDAVVIVDAGALPSIMKLAAVCRRRKGNVILTPHAGEMATLLGVSREEVEQDPLRAARHVANELGAVVVMKGSSSFVASPGQDWRYDGGTVGLATSGSGDVLAGIIAGLAARGTPAADAAIWGVYLHGEAGAELSKTVGPLGFLAREIPACIPRLLVQASESQ